MESLDRPYGDDETDYVTVDPELTGREEAPRDAGPAPTTDEDENAHDPAFQAVEEAGGGVSEGFEASEAQLIENIENAPDADRTLDGFDPDQDVDEDVADDVARTIEEHDPGEALAQPRDQEALRATGEYGEADHEEVSEVTRDPSEEPERGGA